MTINTKYGIGDRVYVVFKETDKSNLEVCVGDIVEIVISAGNDIDYYIDSIYEEFKEEELVPINDKEGLSKRIDELSKEKKDE